MRANRYRRGAKKVCAEAGLGGFEASPQSPEDGDTEGMPCGHGVESFLYGESVEDSSKKCPSQRCANANPDEEVTEEEREGVATTGATSSVGTEDTTGSHHGVALLIQTAEVAVQVEGADPATVRAGPQFESAAGGREMFLGDKLAAAHPLASASRSPELRQ